MIIRRLLGAAMLVLGITSGGEALTDTVELEGEGSLFGGGFEVWRLGGIEAGAGVELTVRGTSGNLDPSVAVLAPDIDIDELASTGVAEAIRTARRDGDDVAAALRETVERVAVAADDDTLNSYDAAVSYRAPDVPFVRVVVYSARAFTNPSQLAYVVGRYRLDVSFEGDHDGATLEPDPDWPRADAGHSERLISIDVEPRVADLELAPIAADAVLQARITWAQGTAAPRLTLRDIGDKTLATAEDEAGGLSQYLRWEAPTFTRALRLRVAPEFDSAAQYSLRVAVDTTLDAPSARRGRDPFVDPTIVTAKVKVDQITEVDQVSESFGVVASLELEWRDPDLAFRTDRCDCAELLLDEDEFGELVVESGTVAPQFILANQQGRRFAHGLVYRVQPSGEVTYRERFDGQFQAPDFDFHRFPFDSQKLRLRLELSGAQDEFQLQIANEDGAQLGPQLGEEQWIIDGFVGELQHYDGVTQAVFTLTAHRHITYYLVRIIIPIAVIMAISYFALRLKDIGKRIDIAAGNLLLLIAINFSIASDLPRLGYATFMDMALLLTFIAAASVTLLNVWLKHLTDAGQELTAARLNGALPMIYLGLILLPLAGLAAFMLR